METKQRRIINFKDIAEYGAYLGIFLIIQFLANAKSPNQYAILASNLMFIILPIVLYGILIRIRKQNLSVRFTMLQLSGLGIAIFFVGGIICSFVSYIYCQYIDPNLIANLIDLSMKTIAENATPETMKILKDGQDAFLQHPALAPIVYSISGFIMNMTYGVFMSLIVGWLSARKSL